MPRLIRLYLSSMLLGAILGAIFAALLVAFDVAGLRHLLFASRAGWIGLFMLIFFHAALFAGVQFGISVMLMADGGRRSPPGRRLLVSRWFPGAVFDARASSSGGKVSLPDHSGI